MPTPWTRPPPRGSPELEGLTGFYFGPKKKQEPTPPFATERENSERLWALSEELTRLKQ